MKRAIGTIVVLLIIAAAVIIALKFRSSAQERKGPSAEAKGDYAQALDGYVAGLQKVMPSISFPDVNRSKILSPAAWKKTVDEYATWLIGSSKGGADRAKIAAELDGIARCAPRTDTSNFLSNGFAKPITVAQFTAFWDSAFFAPTVKVDPDQHPLAAQYFAKGLSVLKLTAHTTYTYEISLVDTAADRLARFTVYPESNAFVPVEPGTYLLICKSSFKPGPGTIWYSTSSVIPLTVPSTPSLVGFTLETLVRRAEGKR
jgi:hypothetical protein